VIEAFRTKLRENVEFGASVRDKLINHLMATSDVLQGQPDESEAA
jgi:hypothetical protein